MTIRHVCMLKKLPNKLKMLHSAAFRASGGTIDVHYFVKKKTKAKWEHGAVEKK